MQEQQTSDGKKCFEEINYSNGKENQRVGGEGPLLNLQEPGQFNSNRRSEKRSRH
jgi:hypothetical protein